MESDDLKDYVGLNRQEFDIYDSPDGLWENIEGKLDEGKKKSGQTSRYKKYFWQVASVSILLIGLLFLLFSNRTSEDYLSPELSEAEAFYQNEIAVKVSQISAIESDVTIFEDIEVLDQAFSELKEDLKDNADNEEVVSAMISTYQVKLQILERILEELETKRGTHGN